jgi:hypothetical protein
VLQASGRSATGKWEGCYRQVGGVLQASGRGATGKWRRAIGKVEESYRRAGQVPGPCFTLGAAVLVLRKVPRGLHCNGHAKLLGWH